MMSLLGFAVLLFQFIGTLFVWFDTERISYAIQPGRAVLTDDPKWKSWRYNKSKFGFALLFIGILLQCLYLFAASERQIELKPELVIAIATAALAIATVILALATARMARETRRTAAAAIKTLELELSPILGFRNLAVKVLGQAGTLTSIHLGVELFNAGRVLVKYEVKSFSVQLGSNAMSGQLAFRGGRILPGASIFLWHPILPLSPPMPVPANGHVRFNYEYSDDSGGQLRSTTERVNFIIEPPLNITWQHVDEASAS
jgi:hypothetical protein